MLGMGLINLDAACRMLPAGDVSNKMGARTLINMATEVEKEQLHNTYCSCIAGQECCCTA
jgi:hypothetical protein